jgi:DMSO/TMAO reductase YedYZ heme-binding membrane subunit
MPSPPPVRRGGAPAIGAGLGLAGGLAAAALGLAWGGAADGPLLAARYTARLAFLLFLPVYLASAWHRLAPGAASRRVVAHRRALGVGFAAAHAVHLAALIGALRAAGESPDPVTAGVGGAAFAATFAMAATSNDAAVRRLGRHWRTLHRAGLHLIWLVFAFTYVTRLERDVVFYAPFAALALAALAARLVAAPPRRRRGRAG